MKRTLNLLFSVVGVALLSPVFVIIAALILMDDGPPVFFRQTRVGKGMKDFTLYKFRSMVNGGKATYPLTLDNDPRVTRFGRLLRKWKLDELPQLVNVIKGDMQMVGCRPELRCYVDQFPEEYAELLSQAPGITDPASLAFRNEEHVLSGIDFEERYVHLILPRKLILSLRYYRTRTLGSDLYVLLRTIFRVIVPPQRYPSQHSITG